MFGWLKRKLIYDLGVNHGQDSEYYLRKGFRVVGVEANPMLVEEVRGRLGTYIRNGQLHLLNVGIWHEAGDIPFYRNLDKDDWSSFDPAYGCRDGTAFEVVNVPTCRLDDLVKEHGVPYYMKIDIEGADKHVVKALSALPSLPRYVSAEEYGEPAIDDLLAAGYTKFHLAPQGTKSPPAEPIWSMEGKRASCRFDGYHSGVFGRDIPAWQDHTQFRNYFRRTLGTDVHEWYDIHATIA